MASVRVTAVAAAIFLLASAPLRAQDFGGSWDRYFRLEAERATSGPPRLTGYIYNNFPLPAVNIRLRVEELDASGRAVSTTIGYVDGEVPDRARAYFEVPVPGSGANYRVRVESFQWQRVGR